MFSFSNFWSDRCPNVRTTIGFLFLATVYDLHKDSSPIITNVLENFKTYYSRLKIALTFGNSYHDMCI